MSSLVQPESAKRLDIPVNMPVLTIPILAGFVRNSLGEKYP